MVFGGGFGAVWLEVTSWVLRKEARRKRAVPRPQLSAGPPPVPFNDVHRIPVKELKMRPPARTQPMVSKLNFPLPFTTFEAYNQDGDTALTVSGSLAPWQYKPFLSQRVTTP